MHATATSLPTFLHGLDGQRIAGTSLVIALHAAVALVLFLPVQQAAAPIVEDPPLILSVIPKYIPPPPRPPPPPINVHIVRTVPQATPIAVTPDTPADDIVDPTDQGTEPYVPPQTIVDTQPAGPSFVEIAADVAPAPIYPSNAIRRLQEGRVLLRVLVDEQGRPTEVSVEQSSGFRLLDESALKAVQAHWHFVPARRDGVAVAGYALVPVVFRIDR